MSLQGVHWMTISALGPLLCNYYSCALVVCIIFDAALLRLLNTSLIMYSYFVLLGCPILF